MIDLDSIRPIVRDISTKVRHGLLSQSDIDSFLAKGKDGSTRHEQCTLLQFCHRMARKGKLDARYIERLISKIYQDEISTSDDMLKPLYRSWAIRYDKNADLEESEFPLALESLIGGNETAKIFDLLCVLDGHYELDFVANKVHIMMKNKFLTYQVRNESAPRILVKSPTNSHQYSFSIESKTGIRISGLTHDGTKSANDDNILFMELRNGEAIIGVADGSGNSANANEVSGIALEAFRFAYLATLDLKLSTKFASAAIRNHNIRNKQDGESTLVLIQIDSKNHANILSIGDSLYCLNSSSLEMVQAIPRPSKRFILGGEPIGDVITISGNILHAVTCGSTISIRGINQVDNFLLASDGILLEKDTDLKDIAAIVGTAEPPAATFKLLNRALESFRRGDSKPDNISVVCGST